MDFNQWPAFSKCILVLLMFCGSCSSSTGGGIKCARVLILLRALRREVRRIAHPRCVEVIKMDGRVIESSTVRGTLVFLGCYVLILQDALNALGYTNRPLDGIFGSGTENAVRAFQRAVSLTADGICGCNTWKKLTAASVGIGRTRTVID